MRDIKPNKNKNNKNPLPPLNRKEDREMELYEATSQRKKEIANKPKPPKQDHAAKSSPTDFKQKKISGNNVPIARSNIKEQKSQERPLFTNHPAKKPSKIQVGRNEYKLMLGLLALVIIAAGIAGLIFLPTATIELRLTTAPLLVEDDVLIGDTAGQTNAVPGTSYFREISIEGSQKVENTEMVGSKSTGQVNIINKTTSQQKIKDQSRLVTEDGTLFYMDKHAIVPPNSSVTVSVTAAEEGSEGNIEPQRLDFAGLDESSQSVLYAKNTTAFSDGSGEKISVVSEEDIKKAKTKAGHKAMEQAKTQIKQDLEKGWTLLEESWDITVEEFKNKQKVGDKIPVIEYQARVTVRVMGYEKEVFEEKMKARLQEKISDDYMLFPGPISYTKSAEDINWKEARAQVSVKVTHSTIADISLDSLKEKLSGRTSTEAREYLEGLPGVKSASMHLWPFWVKSVPKIESRIDLDLKPEKRI